MSAKILQAHYFCSVFYVFLGFGAPEFSVKSKTQEPGVNIVDFALYAIYITEIRQNSMWYVPPISHIGLQNRHWSVSQNPKNFFILLHLLKPVACFDAQICKGTGIRFIAPPNDSHNTYLKTSNNSRSIVFGYI